MAREKAKFDVLKKIDSERIKRNWTEYTLAKNYGIPQSTISTWYRKQLQPSVASIEKICAAFGISVSQFFEIDEDRGLKGMTKDQYELYKSWAKLNSSQKKALLNLIKSMDSTTDYN
jgi:transcriptional regulator with XRE-family HTH domain